MLHPPSTPDASAHVPMHHVPSKQKVNLHQNQGTNVTAMSPALPWHVQVHCGDPTVEARLEAKINEACAFFEKRPQEVAQVSKDEE